MGGERWALIVACWGLAESRVSHRDARRLVCKQVSSLAIIKKNAYECEWDAVHTKPHLCAPTPWP